MEKIEKLTPRKADMILFIAIAALAAIAFSALFFTYEAGDCAEIYVDGEMMGIYPLSVDTEIRVSADGGYNVIVIKDGRVDVTEADCPDGTCVRSRTVGGVGETIVCLPHKLTVRIAGKEAADVDVEIK